MTGNVVPDYGYRWDNIKRPNDDTFVIVTMSGGGSRAAGFAYGVLRKLKATNIRGGRTSSQAMAMNSARCASICGAFIFPHWRALSGRMRSMRWRMLRASSEL